MIINLRIFIKIHILTELKQHFTYFMYMCLNFCWNNNEKLLIDVSYFLKKLFQWRKNRMFQWEQILFQSVFIGKISNANFETFEIKFKSFFYHSLLQTNFSRTIW